MNNTFISTESRGSPTESSVSMTRHTENAIAQESPPEIGHPLEGKERGVLVLLGVGGGVG